MKPFVLACWKGLRIAQPVTTLAARIWTFGFDNGFAVGLFFCFFICISCLRRGAKYGTVRGRFRSKSELKVWGCAVGFINTPEKYGSVTKFFHWSIMLLFLFQFATMIYFRFLEENPTDLTWQIMNWHKTSGLLILNIGYDAVHLAENQSVARLAKQFYVLGY